MRRLQLNRVFEAIEEMTWSQRKDLMGRLKAAQTQDEVRAIVEADEICWLKSCKGQRGELRKQGRQARARGGRVTIRGMSVGHDIVLVVRDRSGACTDQIVLVLDAVHLTAVLQPVLAADAVLCTDGSPALAAAARYLVGPAKPPQPA